VVEVALDAVTVVHADGTVALSHLSLTVASGELLVVTGPSGSGKTTTLRVVAGLVDLAEGSVRIDGRPVDALPPQDRDVALVAQEHALYPHLTVAENLAFPLRLRGVDPVEVTRRVAAESRVLGLSRLLSRRPRTLSAGGRQAVAIGRATTRAPRVFLLDEPLSALDAAERTRLRRELRVFLAGLAVTTIYVTNDQAEALALGDRVAVLRAGALEQVAPPTELLARPANTFVAGFTGTPGMGIARAEVVAAGSGVAYRLAGQLLRVPAGIPGPLRGLVGRQVLIGVRPHQLLPAGEGAPAVLRATVDRVEATGPADLVAVRVGDAVLTARFPPGRAPAPGRSVDLSVDPGRLAVFDAVTEVALWHGRQDAG